MVLEETVSLSKDEIVNQMNMSIFAGEVGIYFMAFTLVCFIFFTFFVTEGGQ